MNAIKELREMRKIILDMKMKLKESDDNTPGKVVNNNFISSTDMIKMIKTAKGKNSMKKVDADFKIEDQ